MRFRNSKEKPLYQARTKPVLQFILGSNKFERPEQLLTCRRRSDARRAASPLFSRVMLATTGYRWHIGVGSERTPGGFLPSIRGSKQARKREGVTVRRTTSRTCSKLASKIDPVSFLFSEEPILGKHSNSVRQKREASPPGRTEMTHR